MSKLITPILSGASQGLHSVKSKADTHLEHLTSVRSEIRSIDHNVKGDDDLLAQIGYKQELKRSYSTLQVFGIAFSIMGLLPSIVTTMGTGFESGSVGLVWGWFVSSIFILFIGISLSILSSSIPTSGGLYYWTNYFAPDSIRVPLSFLIGCSNSLALCGGICSINYGFASEVLAAVFIAKDGDFNITQGKLYGVFAACTVSHVALCSITTKQTAYMQSFSIIINVFIILLFFIAVPAGVGNKGFGFNDAKFIFTKLENMTVGWSQGWAFMLSWMPAIWTIGAFDSCIHMSEEASNPTKSVPFGIIGSISVCGILGWLICICGTACVKNADLERVSESATGMAMSQIIYDALGKKWAIAFMSLVAFAQYLMGVSILIAASRQIWAFARDNGLPFVYNFVKYVNPKVKVPIRATIFAGCFSLILGLLILIDTTAANALFSLAVTGNYISWGMPVLLVVLPVGRSRFIPGPFHLGNTLTEIVHWVTILWIAYVIVMVQFPSSSSVDKETMNYTCVINGGVWIIAAVYYFVWGYKVYTGPKSNLTDLEHESVAEINIDAVMEKA